MKCAMTVSRQKATGKACGGKPFLFKKKKILGKRKNIDINKHSFTDYL